MEKPITKKDFLSEALIKENEEIIKEAIEKEKKGKYHRFFKKVMNEFYEENFKKFEITIKKDSFKINDLKRGSKSVVEYDPDFIIRFKTGEKSCEYIIFEFLDTQADIKTMADISRCVIIDNCRVLFLISKTAKKHKEATRIRNVFIDGFDKLKRGDNVNNKTSSLTALTLHFPLYISKKRIKKEILKRIKKEIRLPKKPKKKT